MCNIILCRISKFDQTNSCNFWKKFLGVAPYCSKRPIYQVTVHFNFIVLNISRLCSKIERRLGADHKRKNACSVQYYSSNIELNVLLSRGLMICLFVWPRPIFLSHTIQTLKVFLKVRQLSLNTFKTN